MNATSKHCQFCGNEFQKRSRDSWKQWEKRAYCSVQCRADDTPTIPLIDRLEAKLESWGDCLIWTGATTPKGLYGVIGVGSRDKGLILTHRAMYEHYVGPIPEGYEVDHLCEVTLCANPKHLEAVTKAENRRRQQMSQTHCHRGHELSEENIYRISTLPNWRVCKICHHQRQRRYHQKRNKNG